MEKAFAATPSGSAQVGLARLGECSLMHSSPTLEVRLRLVRAILQTRAGWTDAPERVRAYDRVFRLVRCAKAPKAAYYVECQLLLFGPG